MEEIIIRWKRGGIFCWQSLPFTGYASVLLVTIYILLVSWYHLFVRGYYLPVTLYSLLAICFFFSLLDAVLLFIYLLIFTVQYGKSLTWMFFICQCSIAAFIANYRCKWEHFSFKGFVIYIIELLKYCTKNLFFLFGSIPRKIFKQDWPVTLKLF